jgi:hypothetical protein
VRDPVRRHNRQQKLTAPVAALAALKLRCLTSQGGHAPKSRAKMCRLVDYR